jgi:hypothetical protein
MLTVLVVIYIMVGWQGGDLIRAGGISSHNEPFLMLPPSPPPTPSPPHPPNHAVVPAQWAICIPPAAKQAPFIILQLPLSYIYIDIQHRYIFSPVSIKASIFLHRHLSYRRKHILDPVKTIPTETVDYVFVAIFRCY